MSGMAAEAFRDATGVSRETMARLEAYAGLLTTWNKRINLIGPNTVADLWRRHLLDSAQLMPHLPADAQVLVDLGSGAGLPGLILAIMGVPEVHLIEADSRKAAFLREAARITGTMVTIHAQRIDKVPAMEADVITARALAPLAVLIGHGIQFATERTVWLLLKGKTVAAELTEAREKWILAHKSHQSLTDPSGSVLRLERVRIV